MLADIFKQSQLRKFKIDYLRREYSRFISKRYIRVIFTPSHACNYVNKANDNHANILLVNLLTGLFHQALD